MDKYSSQIESEKNAISVMDEQIAVLRDKILHQRKMMGGVNVARENQQMIQKQVSLITLLGVVHVIGTNAISDVLNVRYLRSAFLRIGWTRPW